MNRDDVTQELFKFSHDALMSMVSDTREQVNAGLMSSKEAHDRINAISAVIMAKQVGEEEGAKAPKGE